MLVNRRTPAVMVVDEEEPVAEEDVMEIVVETHALIAAETEVGTMRQRRL
jgi:hypothetical protein